MACDSYACVGCGFVCSSLSFGWEFTVFVVIVVGVVFFRQLFLTTRVVALFVVSLFVLGCVVWPFLGWEFTISASVIVHVLCYHELWC